MKYLHILWLLLCFLIFAASVVNAAAPGTNTSGKASNITVDPAIPFAPVPLSQMGWIDPMQKTLADTGQITAAPTIHKLPFGVINMEHEGNITTGIAARVLPYAELSAAVYADLDKVGQWSRIDDERDALSGFHVSVYKKSSGPVVIAFEGTGKTDVRDWITDVTQMFNAIPRQYTLAAKFAQGVIDRVGIDNVVLTGHSLGGGIAQYAAAGLGAAAYTFNPAGLGVLSFAAVSLGGQVKMADITHIITDGYIIDWDTGLVKRKGDVVPKPGVQLGVFFKVPVESKGGGGGYLERHGIENLRDALKAIVKRASRKKSFGPELTIIAVVDSSGSMVSTDPHNLRVAALGMMLDNLGENTILGVVDFDDRQRILAPPQRLGRLGSSVRNSLRESFRRIDSDGSTDIRQGLLAGVGLLDKNIKNATLVLLTDGQDGSGSRWHGAADFIPAGVVVHTIALSDQADRVGLSKLSAATGGVPEIARNAGELQGIISTLFGMAEGDEVLLVRKGNIKQGETAKYVVMLEDDIGRADFQVSWPGSDVDLVAIDPAGHRYTIAAAVADGNGVEGATYDIMHIEDPMAGAWIIELLGEDIAPGGEPFTLRVAAKESKIKSSWQAKPPVPEVGGQFSIELAAQGGVTWKSAEVKIENPDGTQTSKTIRMGGLSAILGGESGETVYSMRPGSEGLYRVQVEVIGATAAGNKVQRTLNRTFRVAVPGKGVKRKHLIKPFIRGY